MSTVEMRSEVDSLLNKVDERFLKVVHAMLEAYVAELGEVVGYEPGGNPITAADLIARAEASNRDIEAGRVYDLEEVMKEDWD
ncbi:MAG: hypothetical protein R2828_15405 [Saprospiraceae bacterium]